MFTGLFRIVTKSRLYIYGFDCIYLQILYFSWMDNSSTIQPGDSNT